MGAKSSRSDDDVRAKRATFHMQVKAKTKGKRQFIFFRFDTMYNNAGKKKERKIFEFSTAAVFLFSLA